MPFLTIPEEEIAIAAQPSTLDNILTIGLVAALALVVIIAVIRKAMANQKAAVVGDDDHIVPPAPVAEAPTAPGAAGQLKLHDVEPKTAAMLMAIVADKMGKPINELRFISIKEVK